MHSNPIIRHTNLEKIVQQTRRNIWIEQRYPIISSLFTLWMIYFCLGLWGIPQQFPDMIRIFFLIILGIASIAIIYTTIKKVKKPLFQHILKRIEEVNHLQHHPLQSLHDCPADPNEEALWNVHLVRIQENLPALKAGWPNIFSVFSSRNAINLALIACFVANFIFLSPYSTSRLFSALRPGYDDISIPLPTIQAWITPPSYSHNAPIYIKKRQETIATDQDARLHISISNLSQRPQLINQQILNHVSLQQIDAKTWQIEGNIQQKGTLLVKARGREITNLTLDLPHNLPPTVTWTHKITSSKEDWKTQFSFKASQYYGLKNLVITINLATQDHRNVPPIRTFSIPLNNHPKTIEQIISKDLSSSIWAGETATATITASDVTGQATTSNPEEFIIQKRQFQSKIAQALNDIRIMFGKKLIDQEKLLLTLVNIANINPETFNDYDIFLNMSGILAFLQNNPEETPHTRRETITRLWSLITDIEERATHSPELVKANNALRAAQESVQEQLDKMRNLNKNQITDADRQELYKRLQQLQSAIAKKMMALSQGQQVPAELANVEMMSNQSVEDLFKDMEKSINSGNIDDVQKQIEHTNQVMNNMRNASPEELKKAAEQAQAQQKMKKLMQILGEIIKKQQILLDQTQARLNQSVPLILRPNETLDLSSSTKLLAQIGVKPSSKSTSSSTIISEEKTAEQQSILNKALQELQKQFTQISGKPVDHLNDALTDMNQAIDALNKKDNQHALSSQTQALVDLQKGNQSAKKFMQQAQQQFSKLFPTFSFQRSMKPGSTPEDHDKNKDPLGRPSDQDNNTTEFTNAPSKAAEIEKELRKRADDPNKSQEDLNYIYRLLNMF